MKPIRLINAMIYDAKIAELGGTVVMNPLENSDEKRMDSYCSGFFGTFGEWKGERKPGALYFYLYIELGDEPYFYNLLGIPDAYSVREREQDIVALWILEE